MEATTTTEPVKKVSNKKSAKEKKVGKHERCPICHHAFGKGTCDSCRDPKCTACGLRLLTVEVEIGTECATCSPEARTHVKDAAKTNGRAVAIALTD